VERLDEVATLARRTRHRAAGALRIVPSYEAIDVSPTADGAAHLASRACRSHWSAPEAL
jgi:hypothetical protein